VAITSAPAEGTSVRLVLRRAVDAPPPSS
jgi:hypothetical protein